MTPEEIAAELASAKEKLAARKGRAGYTSNVKLLEAVIAVLEAQV